MHTVGRLIDARLAAQIRMLALSALAFVAVGIFLALLGRNPIAAYRTIFVGALGSSYGLSEVVVRAIPLMLCAMATAIPARIGLLNVGPEGQLHAGAIAATWGALTFGDLPRAMLLPLVASLGLLGGAAAGFLPAFLRWKAGVNEAISSLLFNYVIVLLVEYLVRGPWKDPMSYNWPFTPEFPDAAKLSFHWGTRIHTGLWFALVAVALFYFVLRRTRWGYEIRVIGDNVEAARRAGIPFTRYVVLTMCVGAALAGLAGMTEVCAIQGRLRPGISVGFGYTGFLVSWLALHHPLGIVVMALLLGVLSVGGDLVQISLGLPYAIVNIIMALIFFIVLGSRYRRTA